MPGHGVTLAEAARALGISESAVKKRLQRGTLAGEKDDAGRWRVALDDAVEPQDTRGDTGATTGPQRDDSALVEQLRGEVSFLRDQLDRAQQAEAEQRRIIAGLLARLPEITAPASTTPARANMPPASPPVQASPVVEPEDTVIPMPPASSPPVEPAAPAPSPDRVLEEEQPSPPPAWNLRPEPHRSIEESLGLAPLATVPVERAAEQRAPWWRRLFGR